MTKNNLTANIAAGMIFLITCVRFSVAHFSYALIIAGIFWGYEFWRNYRQHQWPQKVNLSSLWCFLWGMFLFYGSIWLSGVLIHDNQSANLALSYAKYIIPFFLLWFMRINYSIDCGIKWGGFLAVLIAEGLGIYAWLLNPEIRPGIFGGHTNQFGTFIMLLMPLLIYEFTKAARIMQKYIAGLLILGGFFCLYIIGSRSAIIGLGFGIIITAVLALYKYAQKNKSMIRKWLICIFCGIIVCAGSVMWISSERQGLQKIGGERIMMLEASYEMWQDNKLLGVGLANWQENYYSPQYHPVNATEQGLKMPHNMLAYFFSTAGLLGGIGYVISIIAVWGMLYEALKTNISSNAILCAICIFIAFVIQGMMDQTIINIWVSRIYFALLGYLVATAYGENTSREKENNSQINL